MSLHGVGIDAKVQPVEPPATSSVVGDDWLSRFAYVDEANDELDCEHRHVNSCTCQLRGD